MDENFREKIHIHRNALSSIYIRCAPFAFVRENHEESRRGYEGGYEEGGGIVIMSIGQLSISIHACQKTATIYKYKYLYIVSPFRYPQNLIDLMT